ncbi:MAG: rhomboid family intramembrane serine protease, partial [Pseudomonadota bacterium]|nr:rhomboid family intramembrane serine protease [Pseudomonadota bacterium]
MFPIRDDNPCFLTPYATYGIIVINVIAWLLVQGMGSEPMLSGSVCRLGLIPGQLLQTVPAGMQL